MGADFEGFFGSSPCVGSGEFKGTNDVRMLKHEDVGVLCDLAASEDFWLSEQKTNEVEGMDVEVEQCVTFGIGSCEIVQVVVDKMLLGEPLL